MMRRTALIFPMRRQHGFTLVEAIIVITITSIVAAMVMVFIRAPARGYYEAEARSELVDTADIALRRMARDLRLALPNSIRVQANAGKIYLELLLTKTGGRYLAEEDQPTDMAANRILKFDSANCASTPTDCQFDVVGAMPGVVGLSDQSIVAGDQIVIYNLGPGQAPADAYNCSGECNRAQVASAPAGNRITLTSNPFAAQTIKMRSPSKRFQVVTTPVTYVCDGSAAGGAGSLTRYSGYAIQSAQPVSAAALGSANSAVLATNVVSCSFDYNNLANVRAGLFGLTLVLQTPGAGPEQVQLMHQVHVDNTP